MLEVKALCYDWSPSNSFCFDFSLEENSILVLQGRSGCGKSTLLNLIAGLLTPKSGSIFWQGEEITQLPSWQRPLSILFQEHNLFEHLDCQTNIALGIDPQGKRTPESDKVIADCMVSLGIGGFEKRLPSSLSGGQQQRVALGRVLLRSRLGGRSLVLLDEPLAALDGESRDECCALIKKLVKNENLSVLMVSHDPEDAKRLGAEIMLMSAIERSKA